MLKRKAHIIFNLLLIGFLFRSLMSLLLPSEVIAQDSPQPEPQVSEKAEDPKSAEQPPAEKTDPPSDPQPDPEADPDPKPTPDPEAEEDPEAKKESLEINSARDYMEHFKVGESYFEMLLDNENVVDDDLEILLKTLMFSQRFKWKDFSNWLREDVTISQAIQKPRENRLVTLRLYGNCISYKQVDTPELLVKRSYFKQYFKSTILLKDGTTATVYSHQIPIYWRTQSEIPAGGWRTAFYGLFLKTGPKGSAIMVANNFDFFPPTFLGDANMNYRFYDTVRSRSRLTAQDSNCFYNMLQVASEYNQSVLLQEARPSKEASKFSTSDVRHWPGLIWKLTETPNDGKLTPAKKIFSMLDPALQEELRLLPHAQMPSDELKQKVIDAFNQLLLNPDLYDIDAWSRYYVIKGIEKRLVKTVKIQSPPAEETTEGEAEAKPSSSKKNTKKIRIDTPLSESDQKEINRYLIGVGLPDQLRPIKVYQPFPLFIRSIQQRGRLVQFSGMARRCVRIDIRPGSEENVRWGIDHYYEIEVFPQEFQHYPAVCCVSELPEGFPEGQTIFEPVQITGFFMKQWRYERTEALKAAQAENPDIETLPDPPLLLGKTVLWQQYEKQDNTMISVLIGGGFFTCLIFVWIGIWYFSRSDATFRSTLDEAEAADETGEAFLSMMENFEEPEEKPKEE